MAIHPAIHRQGWNSNIERGGNQISRRLNGVPRLGALALLLLWMMPQQALAQSESRLTPEQGELSNGLTVLTLTDPSSPVLAFQVWYAVGSRDEVAGKTGMAHFFEHLMFAGSENFGPDEHSRMIRDVGGVATGRSMWDATVYSNVVPPIRLELCAQLEADRMRSLNITEDVLREERADIRIEREEQIEGQPLGKAVEELISLAYTSHPYRWPTYGLGNDLDSITLEDLKDFYSRHYAPNRATLVVSGPVSHQEVMEVAQKYFSTIKKSSAEVHTLAAEPEQEAERRAETTGPIQVPLLIVGYHIPPESNRDSQVLDLVSRLLSETPNSVLNRKLVTDTEIAFVVGGSSRGRKDPGLFYVFAVVDPNAQRSDVEAQLFAEIERLGIDGPHTADLQRAKKQVAAAFLFPIETTEGRAQVVGQAALIGGNPALAAERIQTLKEISGEDIQRVVETYLIPAHRSVVWLMPEGGGGS